MKLELSSEVSPSTNPGISAPLAPPIRSASRRNESRICPATLLTGSVAEICTRVECTAMRAATLHSDVEKTFPVPEITDPGRKCTLRALDIRTGRCNEYSWPSITPWFNVARKVVLGE